MKNILILILLLIYIFVGCKNSSSPNTDKKTLTPEIRVNEIYEYKTGISGDEEGVEITKQANHFKISQIVRNADTNFEAVYKYMPETDFAGTDSVELKVSTGSDGASAPTDIKIIKILMRVKQ